MKKILLLLLIVACKPKPVEIMITRQQAATTATLQAISILDANTCWISGHQGTFLRTLDGGTTWETFRHQQDTLQFRDLHALNQNQVVLMTAGVGPASGIYLFSVTEGWQQVYQMPFAEGFLNTIQFWDDQTGLAFGDSFNGELFVLKTEDGGQSWTRIDPGTLPPAGTGEGGFAASGTCISTLPGGKAWIGTGAGGNARLLFTPDYGTTWQVMETPMPKGDMAGIFSTRMATDRVGTLTGGDLNNPSPVNHLAYTQDGGDSWTFAPEPITSGTFYGSDLEKIHDQWLWVIGGPKGMDYSTGLGSSWLNLDTTNYWAVELDPAGFGYAVGAKGNITRIDVN